MKFRVAITETTRQYYEIEAKNKAEAERIVIKLNEEDLDIDDIGEYVGDSNIDSTEFELTSWSE